jgi:hypothetical protein
MVIFLIFGELIQYFNKELEIADSSFSRIKQTSTTVTAFCPTPGKIHALPRGSGIRAINKSPDFK